MLRDITVANCFDKSKVTHKVVLTVLDGVVGYTAIYQLPCDTLRKHCCRYLKP